MNFIQRVNTGRRIWSRENNIQPIQVFVSIWASYALVVSILWVISGGW